MMNPEARPDSLDEDSVQVEPKGAGGSERPSASVAGLETHTLAILTLKRYEGETLAGQLHGEGVAYFGGGHIYKGTFSKGLMDGRGAFTHADGLKYEGEFVCNVPMGQGTYTWLDGSTYEGEVCNCLRHGMGTYKSPKDSVVYTGQWAFGKRHGKGAVYYNQEMTSWYKGEWVRNRKEGWGVRCYPSGNLYSGEWRNNLRHGEGTMRWISLRQQYVGAWQNGVQHGRGTHFWNLSQGTEVHFSLGSQYRGEFVQGQRHGPGRVCFASGAAYDGEWKKDKSRPEGTFTSADGRIFEGDLVQDQVMAHCLSSSRALHPLSDLTPNIQHLLATIPAGQRDGEHQQVVLAVLEHAAELRAIYRFYSGLGRAQSPHGLFQLTRLQLWRLLKDCNVHHHFTLSQADLFIRGEGEATGTDVHSPFTPIFLRQLLSLLMDVAFRIYHKDLVSETSLLADCFRKLVTDDILPNARCVKGFVFRQPDYTVVAVNHLHKCWEMYKNYCKGSAATAGDQTMSCRDLLWMIKDLNLLDDNLTTARLMEVITAERLDPTNLTSCLDEEITFLEFFEVLFGCAEVLLQVSEGPDGLPLSSPDPEVRGDPLGTESDGKTTGIQQAESSGLNDVPTSLDQKSQDLTELSSESQTTEPPGEDGHDKQGVKSQSQDGVTGCEERRTVHQFFSQALFPAFEHKHLLSQRDPSV